MDIKELQTAEYSMTYEDLSDMIKSCYKANTNQQEPQTEFPETLPMILAALTGNYDIQNTEMPRRAHDMLSTWENELSRPKNELVIGRHYIRISGLLLFFVAAATSSGLLDAIISKITEESVMAIAYSAPVNIVLELVTWFQSIQDLEDDEFCIYMQAVTHFKEHRSFSKEDLLEWFPHGTENCLTCNMHNSKWSCDYRNQNSDKCTILQNNQLDIALKSLERKKLLKKTNTTGKDTYQFVRF